MKLLVLDGNSILNRAFFGIKLLTTKEGDFTNGIYGFLTMFKKLWDETQPDAVAIAFDRKAPTFRHQKYAGYKANRKGMPEELAQQLPVLQQLLTDLGYQIVSCEGWEADDILGTLSAQCEREGAQCVIATGDRDSLQLVSPATTVRLATTKFGQPQVTLYDEGQNPGGLRRHPPPAHRHQGHPGGLLRLHPRGGGHRPQRGGGAHPEVRQRAVYLRPPGRAGHQARHEAEAGKLQGQRLFKFRSGHHPPGRPCGHRPLPLRERGGRPPESRGRHDKAGALLPFGEVRPHRRPGPCGGRPRRGAPRGGRAGPTGPPCSPGWRMPGRRTSTASGGRGTRRGSF